MYESIALVAVPIILACVGGWLYVFGGLIQGRPPIQRSVHREVPWNFLDLAFCVAVFILLQVVGGGVVRNVYGLEQDLPLDEMPVSARATMMAVGSAITLLACIIAMMSIMSHTRADGRDFGLDSRYFVKDITIGFVAFLMLAPPVYGIQLLLIQWYPSNHPLINLLKENPDPTFLAISGFSAVLIAPLTEEFFFRGLLQGWLEKINTFSGSISRLFVAEAKPFDSDNEIQLAGVGANKAPVLDDEDGLTGPRMNTNPGVWPMFVSALVFALMHLGNGPDPIPLFFLALGLGYIYRQTHRIFPCIVVHFLLNACSLTAMLLFILQEKAS